MKDGKVSLSKRDAEIRRKDINRVKTVAPIAFASSLLFDSAARKFIKRGGSKNNIKGIAFMAAASAGAALGAYSAGLYLRDKVAPLSEKPIGMGRHLAGAGVHLATTLALLDAPVSIRKGILTGARKLVPPAKALRSGVRTFKAGNPSMKGAIKEQAAYGAKYVYRRIRGRIVRIRSKEGTISPRQIGMR